MAGKLGEMRILTGILDPSYPWKEVEEDEAMRFYRLRLEAVAVLLDLPYSDAYCRFQSNGFDRYGLDTKPPYLDLMGEEGPTVYIHGGNEVAGAERFTVEAFNQPVEGNTIQCEIPGDYWEQKLIVVRIIKVKQVSEPGEEDYPETTWECEVIGRKVTPIYEKHIFSNLDEVYKRFPAFHPYAKYDFSQLTGRFGSTGHFPPKYMSWCRDSERKYRLTLETYARIPPSLMPGPWAPGNWSLQDLELTAHVIDRKAWWIFAYNGQEYVDRAFAEGILDTCEYRRFCRWTQLANVARKEGWSLSERMRHHLTPEIGDEREGPWYKD